MTSTPSASPAARDAARAFCARAMAYLKAVVPDDGDTEAIAPSDDDALVTRPLNDALQVAYLVEDGALLRYVQQRHLDDAGMTRDELHALSLGNLDTLASRVQVRAYGALCVVVGGGGFEASLLLVDRFWAHYGSQAAPNGVVVAIPARDVLAFADRDSEDGLRELDDLCTRAAGSMDHPLVDTLFERIDGRWQPCAPG